MTILKIIAGFVILFWMSLIDIFLVVYAVFGKANPIVTVLIGVWLGYQYNPWLTRCWLKLNRKLDEWADV